MFKMIFIASIVCGLWTVDGVQSPIFISISLPDDIERRLTLKIKLNDFMVIGDQCLRKCIHISLGHGNRLALGAWRRIGNEMERDLSEYCTTILNFIKNPFESAKFVDVACPNSQWNGSAIVL